MGVIALIDTGFIKADKSGTQLDTADIVNAGVAVTLKTASMRFRRGGSTDSNPQPGTFTDTEINRVSFENPIVIISGVINRTVTSDMDNITLLDQFTQTKGVKLVYYTDKDDGYRDLTDSLGSTNNFNQTSPGVGEIDEGILNLIVIFKTFDINNTGDKGLLRYTLTGEVTI